MKRLLTSVFGNRSEEPKRRRPHATAGRKPTLEALEGRELLTACNVSLMSGDPSLGLDGILDIDGTGTADKVEVSIVGAQVKVHLECGTAAPLDKFFDMAEVKRIEFQGLGGADEFRNNTPILTEAWGGSGNDKLYGGSGVDILHGDSNTDELYGNGGADFLYGGTGKDILRGGAGNDFLDAGQDGQADDVRGGSGIDKFVADWASGVNRDAPSDLKRGESVINPPPQFGVDFSDLLLYKS